MPISSLLAAFLAISSPLPDFDDGVEAQLLPLYEETDEGQEALSEAYDNMLQLNSQPININKAGVDELLTIPGIDINSINAILAYRRRYGDFRSLQELDMIPDIDDRLREYLFSVLYVDTSDTLDTPLLRNLSRIRQTVIFTASVPTYYRAGDKGATSLNAFGVNKYADTYLGDPLKHSLRYSLTAGDNLQFNLTGSKTAGEPFFSAGNGMGYDYYSFNISVRQLGAFRQIILGQFRAQFGMGLVLNNNLTFGKQAMLASVGRLTNTFTPHSGTSDARHMQGAAVTVDVGNASISAFWSYRAVDATLNADSSVSTILTDGYHRTAKEMEKKGNVRQMTEGLHLGYGRTTEQGGEWDIGISFLHTSFNRALNPIYSKADTVSAGKMYRLFYPVGTGFWNGSIDYKMVLGGIMFTGETALCENGALATLNNLIWNASRTLTLTAVQRFYSYKYHSFYASGLNEGGDVRNESGVLLGTRWRASRRLSFDAYTDIAYFPWIRYRVFSSSYVWDNCISATLSRSRWDFNVRYRLKLKEDFSHRLRVTAMYDGKRWAAKTRCEGLVSENNSKGFIATQSLTYKAGRKLLLHASASYFDTDDYDSRLYAYERGMLYTFSNASYYGNGFRGAFLVKANVARWLTVQAKVGHTKYFDRSVIGTAERQIFASSQTDIDFQLYFKL